MKRFDLPRMAVTVGEAGELLGISRCQVYKLIRENQFPKPVRIANHHPRWLVSDLEEFLRNSKDPK